MDRPDWLDGSAVQRQDSFGFTSPIDRGGLLLDELLDEVMAALEGIPAKDECEAYAALFDSCKFHGRVDLLEQAIEAARNRGMVPQVEASLPRKRTKRDARRNVVFLSDLEAEHAGY